MDNIQAELKQWGHIKINENLAKHTTFEIGGPAQYFLTITTTENLISALNWLSGEDVSVFILGGGSNLLLPDHEFSGVVVKVETNGLTTNGNIITADAGVSLATVVATAAKAGLTGLEWAIGIPGTIGGAVRGNAGAMGQDMSHSIKSVTAWQDGEIKTMSPAECAFKYRESAFKTDGGVVLQVELQLTPGEKLAIAQAMQGYIKQRTGRYPRLPSAGSFFKNLDVKDWPGDTATLPPLFVERGKVPVGWMVEQVKMLGHKRGGAKVSDEHGNFIVNAGGATQADILTVVEDVVQAVYNKYGVTLTPEVEIIR